MTATSGILGINSPHCLIHGNTARHVHYLPDQWGVRVKPGSIVLGRFASIGGATENVDVISDVWRNQGTQRILQQIGVVLIGASDATLACAPNVSRLSRTVIRVWGI